MGSSLNDEPISRRKARPTTVCDALVSALRDAGVARSFGILGGAVLPLFESLREGGLRPCQFRHEGGAVFAAIEHELAGGGAIAVFTTTGPGITNALTGIEAARAEGARLVLISGSTGQARRRRFAFQATGPDELANRGLFGDGGWFDLAQCVESPEQLPAVLRKLRAGLSRPGGFLAHLSVPLSVQQSEYTREVDTAPLYFSTPTAGESTLRYCARALQRGPSRLWLGHGARQHAGVIRELVDRLDAPGVMSTPRGQGVFPSSDPRFLGVTGFGGDEELFERLEEREDQVTLVLGSRLGEFTSFWDERLVSGEMLHVDLDADVFGAAYPEVETLGVEADIGSFVALLCDHLEPSSVRPLRPRPRPSNLPTLGDGPVRPSILMAAIQRVVVEGTDVPVLSEAGNSFAWTNNRLRFDDPLRYRTSTGFGSMGHMAAGVIGTALARRGPAVAVVGDGAMLMNNEITTAVQLGAAAIWIILNDARLGLVDDGMQGLGYRGGALSFPAVDFVSVAEAMGARGARVDGELELEDVLMRALHCGQPFVVDVLMDCSESAPFGARNRSIADQTAGAT